MKKYSLLVFLLSAFFAIGCTPVYVDEDGYVRAYKVETSASIEPNVSWQEVKQSNNATIRFYTNRSQRQHRNLHH